MPFGWRVVPSGRFPAVCYDERMVAKGGLEDVVAATSAICYLDGERGVLSYQGIDVHDLARASTFEETCFLLWHGRLPDRQELGDLESRLAAARELPEPLLRLIRTLPPADGMEALRTLTSALVHYEGEGEAGTHPGYRRAVHLTGRVGSIVATYGRMSAGGGPVRPDPAMTHAASFLYLLTGDRPSTVAARALDVALILHADHELNASTFAARVTAATLADLDSAIVSAISTLKGPLHGGANAEVMRMLMAIGPDANQVGSRRSSARGWRARRRSLDSGIASIAPRIPGRPTCEACRAKSERAQAIPAGSTCRSASR